MSPPPDADSPGRSHLGRQVLAAASVLTVLVTVGAAVLGVTADRLVGNITTLDVSNGLSAHRPTKVTPATPTTHEPLDILVMGTDTRTGQGGGFGNAADTASGEGHSDTVILLHVSGDRTWALGVSIPRDSWVTRPECGNGNGTVTGKFNAAFASGGPACTIKAVEALTDVRIDHFVVVNFLGFKAVVDALGGVPICVSSAIDDPKSHLTLSAGTHVLQGDQALAFARARKTLGDGSDLSRIDRQQVFMSSVVRTATSSGLLTNPLKLFSVLDAVTKSLTVDPGLGSVDDLKDFALSLQGLSPKQIHFTTVPWAPKGDGANIVWNTTKADQIWQAFRDDTPYPPKTTAPAGQKPLTVAPSAIRVKVLNGSGVNGRARTAAQQLTTLGFVVTGVATAPATVGITTVAYDPSASEAARTLAYAARTTSTSPTTSGRTLTLTVGKDWTSARSVTVVTGSTSSSSSSTLKTADQNTCVS